MITFASHSARVQDHIAFINIIMEELKKHRLSFVEKDLVAESESNNVAKELIENLFFDMARLSTKYDNEKFSDLPYTLTASCCLRCLNYVTQGFW